MSLDKISQAVNTLYQKHLKSVLEQIAEKYSLNKEELIQTYLDESGTPDTSYNNLLCMARKQDLNQCTRKKKTGQEFCGKHNVKQKFGRIDVTIGEKDSDYIMTVKETFPEGEFLVDSNNVVYSVEGDIPTIIGTKNSDGALVLLDAMS